jgi:NAD(P)H-hydrate epimerase
MIAALPRGDRVLAGDLPSGLDAASGEAPGVCVVAGATVTLALPKVGMLKPAAAEYVGRLFLADIGVPRELLLRLGVDPSGLFDSGDLEVIGGPS